MSGRRPDATFASLKKLPVNRPKLLPAKPQRKRVKKNRKNCSGVEERPIIQ